MRQRSQIDSKHIAQEVITMHDAHPEFIILGILNENVNIPS